MSKPDIDGEASMIEWKFDDDDWHIYDEHDSPIAQIYNEDDFPCLDKDNDPAEMEQLRAEFLRNARLIAGAPKLLEFARAYAENTRCACPSPCYSCWAKSLIAEVEGSK